MEQPPSPHEFLRDLTPALRQAAAIARALEGRVANRPKEGEESAVKAALTVADTAAQEALLFPLLRHFRGARLDAEERTPSVGQFTGEQDDTWIVIDPIDGTLRFFLERRGPYGIMAGLALRERFVAALVALPRELLFFQGAAGDGARSAQADGRFRAAVLHAEGRRVLTSPDLPEVVVEALRARGYEPAPACGGAISVAPLVPGVCGGIRVATRSISRRGRIGLRIAREAGAWVRDVHGAPFPDDLDAPAATLVVAASGTHGEALREALAAADYMRV